MGKGKNKNKNKTTDVVEEIEGEKKKIEEGQIEDPDTVKQGHDQTQNTESVTKNQENKAQEQPQEAPSEEVKANQTPQPTQETPVTQPEEPSKTVNQPPKQTEQSPQVTETQKVPQPEIATESNEKANETPINEEINPVNEEAPVQSDANPSQMSQDLRDGLELVGKVAQQILFDPLAHEKVAHGEPQFSQNPLQNVYAEESPILDPHKQEKSFLGLITQQIEQTKQPLQEIKQSIESTDQQPQVLEKQKQNDKINILKSYHSENEQQVKNQPKPQQLKKQQTPTKQKQATIQRKKSEQRRKSDIPVIPINKSQNFLQLTEEQKKDIDYDKLNSDMLVQREKEWQKIQSKTTLPLVPPYQFAHPNPVIDASPPTQPNVPQHLGYTNNLPIIKHQGQIKKADVEEQGKKGEVNSIKKLGVATIVTAACLGVCLLGRLDKKISVGVSIASFITSYLVQK